MSSKLFKQFIQKAVLSKQGPPGPAPRQGLQWKPQTHRWIRPNIRSTEESEQALVQGLDLDWDEIESFDYAHGLDKPAAKIKERILASKFHVPYGLDQISEISMKIATQIMNDKYTEEGEYDDEYDPSWEDDAKHPDSPFPSKEAARKEDNFDYAVEVFQKLFANKNMSFDEWEKAESAFEEIADLDLNLTQDEKDKIYRTYS